MSFHHQKSVLPLPETMPSDTPTTYSTGTVEWFDPGQGVGLISSDDGAPPCAVRSEALRTCGLATMEAGDRIRFRVKVVGGERTATDLTLLPAVQRWENEGGAIRPDA